ncbi:hypothetical protein OSB04_007027 [Centaurea solstitialis]|uniref:SWIM-type domain-containing protein n=1 Tax=Centaurea solstitialis TaxID=347529 RepID=A0AA38U2C6_9ASTR|nr:hypothetical protein OSB04_007027 [Centaurea solstitialis]
MSSVVDKVKLILRSNGEWVEGNERWDYVYTDETVEHLGELKVVYKHDGELLMLTDDEHVSGFMEFAGNSRKPPTLFVYVDYSMCDVGGTSNTTTQEGANEAHMQLSNVVIETQQQQQKGQQQPDDEEEDRTTNRGCADDESHVFNLFFAGIALHDDSEEDEEEDEEGVTLREGVNDYFEMPVFVPTPKVSTTTNQTVPYNRSSRSLKSSVCKRGLSIGRTGRPKAAYRPRDIVDDINHQFGLSLEYATGWRARWNALDSIRGSLSESFTWLPAYLYNLELTNPGTRTSIRVDSEGRFEECFVALSVAGPYLGTMFLVVAMDGNNNIVPIAFGVGRSETTEEWTWFLSMLKRCIGEPEGLVFMSDRAASINAAITAIFPNLHHALCCRHLVMNVRSRDPRIKVFKTPYWKACKAYTTYAFDRMMNILRFAIPDGSQSMEEVGVDRWSRAYFPGIRYNIMTSNSVESINAMSRFARRLPIVGLIEYFRAFQQEWYFIRRAKVDTVDHPLIEWAQHKVWKKVGKSATWTVRGIGYNIWEVQDGGRNANVNMSQHTCECRQWQLFGLPCGHAIVVAKATNRRDVYSLFDVPYFNTENYKATYIEVIKLVGPPETWQSPDIPLPTVLPPIVKKRRVGRPNLNARRPSCSEGSSQRRCPRCGDHGHKSDTCPLFSASASGSSQRSTLEPHGTIRFDSLFQDVRFN